MTQGETQEKEKVEKIRISVIKTIIPHQLSI